MTVLKAGGPDVHQEEAQPVYEDKFIKEGEFENSLSNFKKDNCICKRLFKTGKIMSK